MSSVAPGDAPDPRALNLTFDDGPDPTWTPQVLGQLARLDVTATFFMVGERVLAHPETAAAVVEAGHDVQLHCHRHIRHTELTETELQLDVGAALAALASLGVERPQLWRAPWGVHTEATAAVADRLGLMLTRWSIDTHDWRGDTPEAMLAAARPQLGAGGSVLMHDGIGPGARRDDCSNTVALLPGLTRVALGHGLLVVPMGGAGREPLRGDGQLILSTTA